VARAGGNHDNMVGIREFLQGQAALVEYMTFAEHAYVAMTEQMALEEASLQVR
jgi:hypothetical protein